MKDVGPHIHLSSNNHSILDLYTVACLEEDWIASHPIQPDLSPPRLKPLIECSN